MDFERAKRRHNLKVIISEIIMFSTVIITVIVLAFVVSGYWINEDFEVERQGMLQVASYPGGASVSIDDENSWLQRTTTSRVLPIGEHEIILTKDGYDTWAKVVNISEGLLYRIQYPRLFPLERKSAIVYDATGASLAFLSDERDKLLIYHGDPNTVDVSTFIDDNFSPSDKSAIISGWVLLELKSRDIEPKQVNYRILSEFFKQQKNSDDDNIDDYAIASSLVGTEQLIFSKFYNEHYLTVIDGTSVALYEKSATEPLVKTELTFIPADTHVGEEGEFIVLSSGSQLATIDMESLSIREWSVGSDTFGWLDDSMIYEVADGELIVYDYDGYNRRSLAKNVSNRFPISIVNDEWLYYFSDGNLIRENLIAR